jgi:hypothetical protein
MADAPRPWRPILAPRPGPLAVSFAEPTVVSLADLYVVSFAEPAPVSLAELIVVSFADLSAVL